ncbi:MAG: TonB-dependent receptor [Bacteroidales bacterium]|nr:TonB-dependent receptor [Bacteroidales bacterium]
MTTKILSIIVLLALFLNANAQTGIIRGKAIDGNTGESLVGATVIVLETSPVIATVTDYDGNFSLEKIPVGNHKIKCSFISFQDQIIDGITVNAKDVTVIDIKLETSDQNIDQVIVSANAVKGIESALLTMQKNSVSLINGVSAQGFSQMGDSDAASAVKRVTGVSVESGKYIFVRGLSDRYSKITLNGAEIPGLDPNKNTVQLDIFSTNIIDNIVVQKTFSPNLPASFAGGYVNISTKSFPNKFTLQVSSSVGLNSSANLRDDFLLYQGGSLDWLGVDDGSRAIPQLAQDGVPYLYENNDQLDKISSSFNKIMMPQIKTSSLNHSHSFSIGNQTKIAGNPFGFIFDISYSRNYKFYQNGNYARYSLVEDQTTTQGVMNPMIIESETYGEEEIVTSVLLGLSYKLSSNNKIGFTIMRNGGGLVSARHREGSKPEDNMYMFENTLGFQQRAFTSAQVNGFHVIGSKKTEIEWISSLTNSILSEPDLRFFNYDSVSGGDYFISYSAYPAPARFYRDLDEINFDNKIHVTVPFENFKIKFGGSFTMKNRNSESHKFDLLTQNLDFNGNVDEYLSHENIGQNADATYGVYYQNDPITDKYNSYIANEYLAGAYIMTEFKLGSKINVQTGVRYEYDYTYVENMVENYHPKYVRAEKVYAYDFLPAINLNYSFLRDVNLRFAYSRTLGRPAFREIAPYAYYDFKEGWRVVGNPDLERSIIDNLDLRLEKYMKNGQLISVSGFVKYFTKPIELIDDPRANNPELHYVNADNSLLYGAEIEFRKNLDFINFEDLMIGGNFTIIESTVKYVENYGNTTSPLTVNRPMYGQSPWVLNIFANYENEKHGIASNLGFNVDGPKLSVVTKGSTPDVYQQPVPQFNFNISKRIFSKIVLKASVDNILNSEHKKSYTYNNQEYIFQNYQLGRTFSFSIKYLIN